MLRAFGVALGSLRSTAEELGLPVSIEDFLILHALALAPDQRLSATEVSELVGRPRSTTSDLLKALESTGYLRRVHPESDRRLTQAVLTASGLELVAEWTQPIGTMVSQHVALTLMHHMDPTMEAADRINDLQSGDGFVSAYLSPSR